MQLQQHMVLPSIQLYIGTCTGRWGRQGHTVIVQSYINEGGWGGVKAMDGMYYILCDIVAKGTTKKLWLTINNVLIE